LNFFQCNASNTFWQVMERMAKCIHTVNTIVQIHKKPWNQDVRTKKNWKRGWWEFVIVVVMEICVILNVPLLLLLHLSSLLLTRPRKYYTFYSYAQKCVLIDKHGNFHCSVSHQVQYSFFACFCRCVGLLSLYYIATSAFKC